ncbi:hypothetical protein MC7420_6471 [Coleofasciculus chthonoplastes PCC 7420]|uniref:Transposase putative helix-turn-helix domain-containing protein n=1 Tax=Coleofasciculus chthonoplastes PCC 7420 TaxID=118168 RepID=B4VR00_9CYAN|nr:hypothetical protein MC7420_6471 [Coleofasciculus chthonoplastes PCC 7420]
MILNYTYRIKPDQQQTQLLDEWLETLRVSYNYGLRELKDWIASRKCPIDRCSLESEYIMSGWHIQLPKLGKVEINLHRPIPDGFVVKQVRMVKKAMGWFAVICLYSDVEIPEPSPHGHAIGVDVGLLSYLATSDGYSEPGRKFLLNRGLETYPGTLEKQEIGSQVEVSGAMSLDKWRRGAMPYREVRKPTP